MEWLTPEQAVERAHIKESPQTLSSYPNRSQQKITTEERFQKLGLLFERDRWKANKPYLALIQDNSDPRENSKPDEDTTDIAADDDETSESSSPRHAFFLGNEDGDEQDDETDSTATSKSLSATDSEQPEPYLFEKCTVRLTITFLPDDGESLGRKVILAAGSHGDFPVNKILRLQELGYLPAPVTDLLDELKTDFPNRQVRRTLSEAKAEKKARKKSPSPIQPLQSNSTKTKEETHSNSGTQLTLSFLGN